MKWTFYLWTVGTWLKPPRCRQIRYVCDCIFVVVSDLWVGAETGRRESGSSTSGSSGGASCWTCLRLYPGESLFLLRIYGPLQRRWKVEFFFKKHRKQKKGFFYVSICLFITSIASGLAFIYIADLWMTLLSSMLLTYNLKLKVFFKTF